MFYLFFCQILLPLNQVAFSFNSLTKSVSYSRRDKTKSKNNFENEILLISFERAVESVESIVKCNIWDQHFFNYVSSGDIFEATFKPKWHQSYVSNYSFAENKRGKQSLSKCNCFHQFHFLLLDIYLPTYLGIKTISTPKSYLPVICRGFKTRSRITSLQLENEPPSLIQHLNLKNEGKGLTSKMLFFKRKKDKEKISQAQQQSSQFKELVSDPNLTPQELQKIKV